MPKGCKNSGLHLVNGWCKYLIGLAGFQFFFGRGSIQPSGYPPNFNEFNAQKYFWPSAPAFIITN